MSDKTASRRLASPTKPPRKTSGYSHIFHLPGNGLAAEVPCTCASKEATARHGPVTAPSCSVYPQSGKSSDVRLKLAHCRFSCPMILGIPCRPRHRRGNRQATSEAVTRRPSGSNSTRSPAAGCQVDNGPRERAKDQA